MVFLIEKIIIEIIARSFGIRIGGVKIEILAGTILVFYGTSGTKNENSGLVSRGLVCCYSC